MNIADSDIRYGSSKSLGKLLMLGFVGGWVAGALGLGGGSIYNPALLSMGIPPKVSSATGLVLVTFSTFASTLFFFLNDLLNITYALEIGLMSVVGMMLGSCIANHYVKKSGRQSIIVWVLAFLLIISVVVIPIIGTLSLLQDVDEGLDVMAFKDICSVK